MKTENCKLRIALIAVVGLFATGCSSGDSSWRPRAETDTAQSKSEAPKADTPQKNVADVQPAEKTPAANTVRTVTPKSATGPKWNPNGVADFKLTERSGKAVTRADLLGKPWVACFLFTHCAGFCGQIAAKMHELQEWMKREKIDGVKIVTITVDPERDTPERLAGYAENFSADKDRWWFLTGDKAKIFTLIRDSFGEAVGDTVGAERQEGFEVFHTSGVLIVNADGKIVARHKATDPVSMAMLRKRLQQWNTTGSLRFPVKAEKPKNRSK